MIDDHLRLEAAQWHGRMLDSADPIVIRDFEAWRRTSAAHGRAFEQVSAAHDEAQSLSCDPALLRLRHEAVARAMLDRRPLQYRKTVLAAAILLLATGPLAAWGIERWALPVVEHPTIDDVHTDIGQQTTLALPDGSEVTLDTNSRLHIAFGADERRVTLTGQAFFQIKGSPRPFVIIANDRTLRTTGGRFNVRTDGSALRALTDTGHLGLIDGNGSIAIEPGRLLSLRGSDVTIRTPDDVQTIIDWRTGRLQLDDVPLGEAIGELNRYRHRPIRIADERAARLRVSGAFRTQDSSAFLSALTTGFPVRVARDDAHGVVIASR